MFFKPNHLGGNAKNTNIKNTTGVDTSNLLKSLV